MGRTVATARKKGAIPAATIQRGINLHLNCQVSIRKAAKDLMIPFQTLHRYVTKAKRGQLSRLEPNYSVNKVFTEEQESSLKEYVVECSDKFYGLTAKECRQVAYQMAKKNHIKMPKSWEDNKCAGKDWLRGFRKRFPDLRIRKPEPCSLARATAFNETNIRSFFANLKNVCQRTPSFGNGSRIYNLDETATTTVQRPQRVLTSKGHNVCKVTSGERGVLVTTCCIVNARGQALPPAMIFPRKNYKPHMLTGAPPGTLGLASPNGWMNAELFVQVMRHFINNTSASKNNPALLIMDNHESHLSIEALDLAKDNGVTILTLHPHTTAKMQPLDVGLHAPFKTFYNAAVDSFLMRHPGKPMTIYHVAECVGIAYLKAMTPMNITNAFKKCGIFPYDDQIFTEIDFLPSSVTDRPRENDDNNTDIEDSSRSPMVQPNNNVGASPSVPAEVDQDETDAEDDVSCHSISVLDDILHEETPVLSQKTRHSPELLKTIAYKAYFDATISDSTTVFDAAKSTISCTTTIDKPNTSRAAAETIDKPSTSEAVAETMDKPSTSKAAAETKQDFSKPHTSQEPTLAIPSTSKTFKTFISPKEFRPPLKAEARKKTQKSRKCGKSIIATDTPEKDALAAKKKKTVTVKNKKVVKRVKQDLFKKNKKAKKQVASPETSDDENEIFICSGSSSGGEDFVNESDDEEVVLNCKFSPLPRETQLDDYVLIRFRSKNDDIYYVARILENLEEDEDCDYFVSYLKLKSKVQQKFVEPLEPDTAGVKRMDITYILPTPKTEGTSRRKSTYKFPVDMSQINLRY